MCVFFILQTCQKKGNLRKTPLQNETLSSIFFAFNKDVCYGIWAQCCLYYLFRVSFTRGLNEITSCKCPKGSLDWFRERPLCARHRARCWSFREDKTSPRSRSQRLADLHANPGLGLFCLVRFMFCSYSCVFYNSTVLWIKILKSNLLQGVGEENERNRAGHIGARPR